MCTHNGDDAIHKGVEFDMKFSKTPTFIERRVNIALAWCYSMFARVIKKPYGSDLAPRGMT